MKQGTKSKGQDIKGKGVFYPIFCFLLLAACFLPSFAEDLPQKESTETPKVHIVKKGDTLWDISNKYLNNPFKWHDIWDKNKFITNPDLIHPGNNIAIPGIFDKVEIEKEIQIEAEPEIIPELPEEKIEKIEAEVDEDKIPELPQVTLQPPPPAKIPLTTEVVIATSGYIIPQEMEKGIVFDSPESRTIFGRGDAVYINIGEESGAKVGSRFTAYKPLRVVIHPVKGNTVGVLIEILGELEIKEVRDDSSTASIIESYKAIELGDKLKEREDITIPMIDPAAKVEPKDMRGYIIAAKEQKTTVGTGDIVYIDLGSETGVSAGDRFTIFKNGGEKEKKIKRGEVIKLPKVIVGTLQVITPMENTSTAIIRDARKEIVIGEMIEYEKR